MQLIRTLSLTALVFASACGQPTRLVSGSIDLAALGRTEATVVALSDDGATTTSEVRQGGRFEIELEVGHEHALAFRGRDGARDVTFANVVVHGESRRSSRLRAVDAEPLELGELEIEHGVEVEASCTDDVSGATSGSTMVVASTGDHDVGDDHGGDDAITDGDGDGRPDQLDDDRDDDGLCDVHGANSGHDGADDVGDDHGTNRGSDGATDVGDDHGGR